MRRDSKKWNEDYKAGEHAVVRFDIYCDSCNRQLAKDSKITNVGLVSDSPMCNFCDIKCAKDWQNKNGKTLWNYGYTRLLPNEKIQLEEMIEE